jgi:small subunit ribosomal protein S4e
LQFLTWSIPRKGSKYLTIASHEKSKSIPLVFILRDMLKIAKTKKEARHLLLNGELKVNNKIRRKESFPIQVFDVISLEKLGKNYKLEIVNKKFTLKEISNKEAEKKIIKISGKKILKNKKIQMNLEDGQNLLTSEKFEIGDSIILNTKKGKLKKIIPLEKEANVEIVLGKYAGEKGKLKDIKMLERSRRYLVELKGKEAELPFKAILVIE